jgi:hypothetical protein
VQVNDLVAVFMRILYAALHRALLPPRRCSKKPQLSRHIRKLIIKKRRLWKKVRDGLSLNTYRKPSCRKVRKAVRSHVSSREQELLVIPVVPASITMSTTTLAGLDNQCGYSTVLVALSQLVTAQQKSSMLSSPKTLLELRLHWGVT